MRTDEAERAWLAAVDQFDWREERSKLLLREFFALELDRERWLIKRMGERVYQ